MAHKKSHLVRNILLLTASSWWTFSGAWRRWLEPWCKAGAANVKAAPESAGGPGLSGLLLGAHFGLLCNQAPAPPVVFWCSAGCIAADYGEIASPPLRLILALVGRDGQGGLLCETK